VILFMITPSVVSFLPVTTVFSLVIIISMSPLISFTLFEHDGGVIGL
jgi:hypothetical protein